MAKLLNSVIQRITERIERNGHCVEEFLFSFPENSQELAIITFRAYPEFIFSILDQGIYVGAVKLFGAGDGKKQLKTYERPGDYKNYESKNHEDIDGCIDRLSSWLHNIQTELKVMHDISLNEVDEIVNDYHKRVDECITDPTSYFSEEEKEHLFSEIDKLQEKVSALEKKFDLTESQSKSIQETIANSKKSVGRYPKGIWFKTTGSRLISAIKKVAGNKEAREFIFDMARNLLDFK